MENLWAPWRVELFRQPHSNGCFFCDYVKQDQDEQNLVLERGTHCFVVMNRFPYTNGHLMVVPYQHTGQLRGMDAPTRASLLEYAMRWQTLLAEAICAQGFNIGINVGKAAGAGVDDHLHVHLVPRWTGDTNFMPIIADTKVINQSLSDLYRILKAVATTKPAAIC